MIIPKVLFELKDGFYTAYTTDFKTQKMKTVVIKKRYASVSVRDNVITIFINEGPAISIIDGVSDKPEYNWMLWKMYEFYALQN